MLEVGSVRVKTERAELYEKGGIQRGRSFELRAEGVTGLSQLRHPWPAVVVRCNGDLYHGRVFVDRSAGGESVRLFGYLGQV